MRINLDKRFCSLVPYVAMEYDAAATVDMEYWVRIGELAIETGKITGIDAALFTLTNGATIFEPHYPVVLPGGDHPTRDPEYVHVKFKNVDNVTYKVSLICYLFDIRVRELTPMGQIIHSVH